MNLLITLVTLFFSISVFSQGTLDVYDREAVRGEEYGSPSIGKEEMEQWPMHPDELKEGEQQQVEAEELYQDEDEKKKRMKQKKEEKTTKKR